MSWWIFAGLVVLQTLVLTAPGYLVARTTLLSRGWAVLASPALGLGVLGLTSTGLGLLGVQWGWASYLAMLTVLVIAWCVASRRRGRTTRDVVQSGISNQALMFGLVGVAVTVIAGSFAFGHSLVTPDALPMTGDSTFHLYGTNVVAESGNANPINALAFMYDKSPGTTAYYPLLWHAFTALIAPLAGVVVATNVTVFVVAFVVWPLSLALLSIVLFPKAPAAPLFSSLFAVGCVIFPAAVLIGFAIYPFSLGIAVFPAVIGVGLLALASRDAKLWILLLIGVSGTLFAQPSVALLLIVPISAVLFVGASYASVRAWRRAHRWRVISAWLAGGGVLTLLIVVLLNSSYVQALGRFSRPSFTYTEALKTLVNGEFILTTSRYEWLLVLVLTACGVWLVHRTFNGKVVVLSGVFFVLLYIASAGPDNWVRILTGPWYKDYQRLSVPVLIVVMILAGGAVAEGIGWIARRSAVDDRIVFGFAGVILLVSVLALNAWMGNVIPRMKAAYMSMAYSPSAARIEQSPEDVEELRKLEGEVPSDALVLSLPTSTMDYLFLEEGINPYFRISPPVTADQRYLAGHFSNFRADPRVCEIIRESDAYYYLDYGTKAREIPVQSDFSGFADVDIQEGFTLISQTNNWKLLRITACD
ncbi:DUF6541 family protein [Actinomyces minihominis]|uniref:DUF6541 family protein n=1 Tax=Actinomyces minihominis TaxID=2002838 RepID=UPI00278BCD51|nr:DUF6541 family protein [Actinomyces minihominis]